MNMLPPPSVPAPDAPCPTCALPGEGVCRTLDGVTSANYLRPAGHIWSTKWLTNGAVA